MGFIEKKKKKKAMTLVQFPVLEKFLYLSEL